MDVEDQDRSERRATERHSRTELAVAVGRVEAIVTASARDLAAVKGQLHDHGVRIQALEEDRIRREAAKEAAAEAIAEERLNEDRWGRHSPRAVVLAGLGAGGATAGALVAAVSQLLR